MSEDSESNERPKAVQKEVDLSWGLKIPLRDGVHLTGNLYRPKEDSSTPAIITLTPYTADTYHEWAYYFAQHGYAFLLVDCRGRGNSEGDFEPLVNEGRDGHDVVEWVAAQPWCDGSVAMWGGSYAGANQWTTLKEFPSHLKTIVPAAAVHAAVSIPFFKNIFPSRQVRLLTLMSGITANRQLGGAESFWTTKFHEHYIRHLPFAQLDRIVGNPSPHFQTWLRHPTPDDYWDRMALTPNEYGRIDIPILTITGYYDRAQPGALHYYRLHMKHGSAQARAQHYLVIGPWDHAGTRTPQREVAGLKFGEASLVDLNKLHREWYDWCLKGGSRPEFLKDRVAYYLMGAEEWRYADGLEALDASRNRLYLDSRDGHAHDVFHSGQLSDAPPETSEPDTYVYDPLDIRPGQLEWEPIKNHLTDQRHVLNRLGGGLVYHSDPFERDTEITGFLRFVAWMALDVPDTDFMVTVSEILADGSHIHLTRDFLRARYRESLTQEKLVTPRDINRYVFDGFTFFSRQVAEGSRLRLLLKAPNTIFWEKNYNSGGVVAEESGEDARVAHVTLHHDAEHPSFLEIPVIPENRTPD